MKLIGYVNLFSILLKKLDQIKQHKGEKREISFLVRLLTPTQAYNTDDSKLGFPLTSL